MMKQYHKTLNAKKWMGFDFSRQVLMIANEINRAKNCYMQNDNDGIINSYNRALELLYLTIECQKKKNRRRELLRWKELLLQEYISDKKNIDSNMNILKAILLFTPGSYSQIKYLIK